MNNLSLIEFNKSYVRRCKNSDTRDKKIQSEISELQSKIKELENKKLSSYPSIEKVFKPIADKLKKVLKAKYVEKYGAFGLCAETSFYFLKNSKDICKRGNVLGSITFINHNDGWAIRNHKKQVHNYPKGSIADMNGMNDETIEITEKMDFDWLVNFVKRRN